SGLGIGRLPVFIGEAESDLIRFENGVILPSVPIWLLSHPDLRRVRRIRVFNDFIKEKITSVMTRYH
ncbi:MAG: LysR family transcriptional regulator, partial [Gammaproteobacteria bacterium]|nr:LysR family transcriptional regulator [Gammaproteobacteria bacterium]